MTWHNKREENPDTGLYAFLAAMWALAIVIGVARQGKCEPPTGEPVACFYGGEVRCFVDAAGT